MPLRTKLYENGIFLVKFSKFWPSINIPRGVMWGSTHSSAVLTFIGYKQTDKQSIIQLRTFPWFYRVPNSKLEANQSRGSWVMIGLTNKQTKITNLYIYHIQYIPVKKYTWYPSMWISLSLFPVTQTVTNLEPNTPSSVSLIKYTVSKLNKI